MTEDLMRDLYAPIVASAAVRETAAPEDEGSAVIREAKADLRTRYRLTETQAQYVVDRAVPSIGESWKNAVTREASDYIETLPAPEGPEGALRMFDQLVEARGGR